MDDGEEFLMQMRSPDLVLYLGHRVDILARLWCWAELLIEGVREVSSVASAVKIDGCGHFLI